MGGAGAEIFLPEAGANKKKYLEPEPRKMVRLRNTVHRI